MTAPYYEQKLANREPGTVDQIDKHGSLKLRMDSGREVEFNARQHPDLDKDTRSRAKAARAKQRTVF